MISFNLKAKLVRIKEEFRADYEDEDREFAFLSSDGKADRLLRVKYCTKSGSYIVINPNDNDMFCHDTVYHDHAEVIEEGEELPTVYHNGGIFLLH